MHAMSMKIHNFFAAAQYKLYVAFCKRLFSVKEADNEISWLNLVVSATDLTPLLVIFTQLHFLQCNKHNKVTLFR